MLLNQSTTYTKVAPNRIKRVVQDLDVAYRGPLRHIPVSQAKTIVWTIHPPKKGFVSIVPALPCLEHCLLYI
jgi:hypothetical protein